LGNEKGVSPWLRYKSGVAAMSRLRPWKRLWVYDFPPSEICTIVTLREKIFVLDSLVADGIITD
jgi:hypothetical protein